MRSILLSVLLLSMGGIAHAEWEQPAMKLYFHSYAKFKTHNMEEGYIFSSSTFCIYISNNKVVSEQEYREKNPDFPDWDYYKCKISSGGAM